MNAAASFDVDERTEKLLLKLQRRPRKDRNREPERSKTPWNRHLSAMAWGCPQIGPQQLARDAGDLLHRDHTFGRHALPPRDSRSREAEASGDLGLHAALRPDQFHAVHDDRLTASCRGRRRFC